MKRRPCIFGEVLFDRFPDGQQVLGGAPFNVAWHLQAFGLAPRFVSRVGRDSDGDHIAAAMRDWGLDRHGLQRDAQLPTGRVQVSFEDGEPHYDILHRAAWDAIEPVPGTDAVSGVFYHGSLALRDAVSRDTALALRSAASGLVFMDVNLRSPWWQADTVVEALAGAHWVKLNRDELALLGFASPEALMATSGLQGVILTHGGDGAELLTADGVHERIEPEPVAVVDTVGAGDAFASVVILGLSLGWSQADLLPRAQRFASAICGRRGATVHDRAFYQPFLDEWPN